MPINDYDGTTQYQIGKVYDYDGTTQYQIGKVYDCDGTTNSLIYSAETQIYPGTAVSHVQVLSQGTTSGFYVTAHAGTNLNSTAAYIPVDLTGISSLTVYGRIFINTAGSAYAGVWLSSPTQFGDYNIRYPYYTVGPGDDFSDLYTQIYRITTATEVAQCTFDVSGLSGTYYLCAGAYCNTTFTANDNAGVRVDTVTVS